MAAPNIAKSLIVFDVKPWDDETDMGAMEKAIKAIETDGLLWEDFGKWNIFQQLIASDLFLSFLKLCFF